MLPNMLHWGRISASGGPQPHADLCPIWKTHLTPNQDPTAPRECCSDIPHPPAWVREALYCSLPRLGTAPGSSSLALMASCTYARASLSTHCSVHTCRNPDQALCCSLPRPGTAPGSPTSMSSCTPAHIRLKLPPSGPCARRNPDHAQCCALLRLVAMAVHSWHERGMVHGAVTPQACHWFGAHNAVKLGSLSAWACCNGFMPVRPDVHYAAPEVRNPLNHSGGLLPAQRLCPAMLLLSLGHSRRPQSLCGDCQSMAAVRGAWSCQAACRRGLACLSVHGTRAEPCMPAPTHAAPHLTRSQPDLADLSCSRQGAQAPLSCAHVLPKVQARAQAPVCAAGECGGARRSHHHSQPRHGRLVCGGASLRDLRRVSPASRAFVRTGASMLVLVILTHTFRGLYCGNSMAHGLQPAVQHMADGQVTPAWPLTLAFAPKQASSRGSAARH